jgi:hypothetical protein
MLATISIRINKNKFIYNHPKRLYSLRKQPTCSLHMNKIYVIHLRQSQCLKLITKLYSNSKLKDKCRGRSAPVKHQACHSLGRHGHLLLEHFTPQILFSTKLELVSHTFKTA